MLTATALPRDGHGWPISSSLAPVRLPSALPTPLWRCATVPTDPPAPAPAGLTTTIIAQADASTHVNAPALPRGFTLREIPHIEALWRRTGRTPTLRASRQTSIPSFELPAGLHMLLSLNGQKLRLLRPGLNVFTPELILLPGDRLRFEFYPGGLRPEAHLTPSPSPRRGEGSQKQNNLCPLATCGEGDGGEVPTVTDLYHAIFGPDAPAPAPRPTPFANLTRFQRQQRGLLGRLLSSLTEGGRS